jgi:hypothetical protein
LGFKADFARIDPAFKVKLKLAIVTDSAAEIELRLFRG